MNGSARAEISDDALVENTQLQVVDGDLVEEDPTGDEVPSDEYVDPADEDGETEGEEAGPEDPGDPSDSDEDGEATQAQDEDGEDLGDERDPLDITFPAGTT